MPDADGYGYSSAEHGIGRLLDDMRTLSAPGLRRIAGGWDAQERAGLDGFHAAQKAALKALEAEGKAQTWEELRRRVLDLTEGRAAMESWRAEHGEIGHKAERAALGAALALTAFAQLSPKDYATLAAPMAEALPWLALP
mgnify:CR=1 FL=1